MKITSPRGLADALQQARKQQNQTQKTIGALAGTKQSTVSAFETSPEHARIETLFKLLSALNMELVLESRGQESANGPANSQAWDQEW
ncbi:helix-turn-helix domain-containing protein [Thalassolituus marinus]|uniref:Helix-turn-helix domain-containing protein n=1 Tax=Thalassolituus marinus TaxID=671053 RepID=A0ABS7ZR99_9GAMM|nr:helix-turn-helix domain-containing protein [Thalassolituus marinus]MCA6063698.1 helix-turn-helix domain-containing protein [Thalassolituus marinus]